MPCVLRHESNGRVSIALQMVFRFLWMILMRIAAQWADGLG